MILSIIRISTFQFFGKSNSGSIPKSGFFWNGGTPKSHPWMNFSWKETIQPRGYPPFMEPPNWLNVQMPIFHLLVDFGPNLPGMFDLWGRVAWIVHPRLALPAEDGQDSLRFQWWFRPVVEGGSWMADAIGMLGRLDQKPRQVFGSWYNPAINLLVGGLEHGFYFPVYWE